MEKDCTEPTMDVFSTDMAQKFPMSTTSSKSGLRKKTLSFPLLPIRSRKKIKKSQSICKNTPIEEEPCDQDSDKVMLSDDFTSSSDEDEESGHVNISFDSEINSSAMLYKTFGRREVAGGNLQDGSDIHFLDKGKCIVSDLLNCRLIIFSKSGKIYASFQNEETIEPWAIAQHENVFLVTSRRKKCVVKLSETGNLEDQSFGGAYFQDPCGIAVTRDHRIVVSDVQSKRVSVHQWSGEWLFDLSAPDNSNLKFKLPRYVIVSPNGDMIVSDSGNHCIFLFSADGYFKKTFGSYGSCDGQLKAPYGICCDQFGNIFVADHYNDRISFFTKEGVFVRQIITKHDDIYHPQGISFSQDMKLFVTHGSLKACEVKVFTLVPKSVNSETDRPEFQI